MKVHAEFLPHKHAVEVWLGYAGGGKSYSAKPMTLEFASRESYGVLVRGEDGPALELDPEVLVDITQGLYAECQRLGLIRRPPSEERLEAMQAHLADLKQIAMTSNSALVAALGTAVNRLELDVEG